MEDMGVFYSNGYSYAIPDYEISFLHKKFSVDRKGFCLYDKKDLDKTPAEETLRLYEQHGMIIQLKDLTTLCDFKLD